MPIDWNAVATTVVSAVFVGVLGWLAVPLIQWRARRKDRYLLDLARLRTHGVALRNVGAAPLRTPALEGWMVMATRWESDVAIKASQFDKTEGERIKTLDLVPALEFPGVVDEDHLRLLRNVSETIKRVDELLERNLPGARQS